MSDEREALKRNLSDENTWLRLLFMILFAVLLGLSDLVLFAVVLLQFGFVLFGGERNRELLEFGARLARFRYQVVRFLTYNDDARPWPFSPWPAEPEPAGGARAPRRKKSKKKTAKRSSGKGPS